MPMMKISRPRIFLDLIVNMGVRYTLFRVFYEIRNRLGLNIKKFRPQVLQDIDLNDLADARVDPKLSFAHFPLLEEIRDANKLSRDQIYSFHDSLMDNEFTYFSYKKFTLPDDQKWHFNPVSGESLARDLHFSQIRDFSKKTGDIKYVWEPSRFCFLQNLLLELVATKDKRIEKAIIDLILDWIDENPINLGPNYKCGQEISFRIFNWVLALSYIRDSEYLTAETLSLIEKSIYFQTLRVEKNINFARFNVRNNHAISESLCLYFVGIYFPHFNQSLKWKIKGRKFLEQEFAYQIYPDGGFLQFSFNYHRLLLQLISLALKTSSVDGVAFPPLIIERFRKTIDLFAISVDFHSGRVPNYGANDGALLFNFSSLSFTDYRQAVQCLYFQLYQKPLYPKGPWDDEYLWLVGEPIDHEKEIEKPHLGTLRLSKSGLFGHREESAFTFIKCATYKDRPSQADNLHLDLWSKGNNFLRDAGSYQYNTDKETVNFFSGTSSHNTIQLDDYNQMYKGKRFIWNFWDKGVGLQEELTEDFYLWSGKLETYKYLCRDFVQKRTVVKLLGRPTWLVFDSVSYKAPMTFNVKQLWNTSPADHPDLFIRAFDENGIELSPLEKDIFFSDYYGKKEKALQVNFSQRKQSCEFLTLIGPKDAPDLKIDLNSILLGNYKFFKKNGLLSVL